MILRNLTERQAIQSMLELAKYLVDALGDTMLLTYGNVEIKLSVTVKEVEE